jgi:lysophospholipase L1-like esterase
MNRCRSLFIFSALLLAPLTVKAECADIGRLPDINCDGSAQIVVLGDSLVAGIGDSEGREGGYVSRTQEKLLEASLIGYGVPGLRTLTLFKRVRDALSGKKFPEMADSLRTADLIVLDLGRNDRWLFGEPAATLRNLQRIRNLIISQLSKDGSTAPLVVTAVLMYPNRGSQGPWVKDLNALILAAHTSEHPCDLRFDLVSKRLLSEDNIHPTGKGYAAIASVFLKYLLKQYPKYSESKKSDQGN